MSYYELLGVSPDVSGEEIRKAYLQLAHKYHPDTGGSKKDEEKLKEINAAYHCLKNPKKRLQYDLGIHCPPGVSPAAGTARARTRPASQESARTDFSHGQTRHHESRGAGASNTTTRASSHGTGRAGFSDNARARSYRPGANRTSTAFHDNLGNIHFGQTTQDDEKVMVGDPMHDIFWVVCRAVSAVCLIVGISFGVSTMGVMGVLPGLVVGVTVGETLAYVVASTLAVILQITGVWRPSDSLHDGAG